jgi:hypothetical protein
MQNVGRNDRHKDKKVRRKKNNERQEKTKAEVSVEKKV